ncbi:MAG: phage portal protein [Planctomycetes bacterium]|nr:phage portal protein [Planctomycetota bacterium]
MTAALQFSGAWQGAAGNRLMGPWRVWENDPNSDWTNEAASLSVRAWDLVRNDPVMAALLTAKIIGTHGAEGLRLRSQYSADRIEAVSDAEVEIRRHVEDEVAAATSIDATGLMTRHEFEEALDELATVSGESFAVRLFIPDRPGATTATCWRIIRPERVCNPPGKTDSNALYQGLALDDNGAIAGIWIAPPRRMGSAMPRHDDWAFVPWYAEDGSRNVIHRIGKRMPGSYRGVSLFAANIPLAKQIKGVLDAYVVAKRVQACHPIFISCDDPLAAAAADRNGAVWGPNTTLEPGKVYYVGRDASVNFSTWSFQGADMREFLDTLYRNQFAALGMPIDVVLAQLGNTNMAASRSAWLQYYRQCTRWQDDHIEQVSRVLDEAIIREAVARGRLSFPADMPWPRIMCGRYVRPPRSMPDPLKEAMAVKAWVELGRDRTGLFAESGVDFRDSIVQRADDDRWMESQGVESAEDAAEAAEPAPAEAEPAKPDEEAPPKPEEKQP